MGRFQLFFWRVAKSVLISTLRRWIVKKKRTKEKKRCGQRQREKISKRVLKTKGEREKKVQGRRREREMRLMMALTPKRLFLSLSASLSLFSALALSSHAHLWSLKLSLKMRVSSKELFSTLKKRFLLIFRRASSLEKENEDCLHRVRRISHAVDVPALV